MEDYCRDQHIFFNENERIRHSIKASEGLYREFRGSLHRGFKNYKMFEDHPELSVLMASENEIDVQQGEDGSLRIVKKQPTAPKAAMGRKKSDRDLMSRGKSNKRLSETTIAQASVAAD